MPAGFVGALKAHARELLQLQGEQANRFLRYLRELQERLRGRLLNIAPADETLDVLRLRRALSESEASIRVLEYQGMGLYQRGSEEAVQMAVDHLGDDLERLSGAFEDKAFDVTISAQKVLADPAQQLLAEFHQSSLVKYGQELLQGVRQRLFMGMRTGDSMGDVARDIAGQQGVIGTIGRTNAERLVRTETSQAYGVAQQSGLVEAKKEIPGLKKIWMHIGSFRCPVCMPLHGTERDLDGTWTVRSGRRTYEVAHAPAHPHCVCRVSGMKPSWRNQMQKLGYLDQEEDNPKSSPSQL